MNEEIGILMDRFLSWKISSKDSIRVKFDFWLHSCIELHVILPKGDRVVSKS